MKYPCLPEFTGVALDLVDMGSVKGTIPQAEKHIFLEDNPSWYIVA